MFQPLALPGDRHELCYAVSVGQCEEHHHLVA
jgi:hypothetical protein